MYSLNYRQPKIDYSSVYSSLGKDVFDDDEEGKKQQNNSSSIIGSLGSLGNIASGLFGNSNKDSQYGLPTQSMPTFKGFGDSGKVGEYASDIFGLGKQGYNIFNTLKNSGGSSSVGGAGYLPMIMGAVNAGSTALKGGSFKDDVPQSFFGINSESDSDVMQALKGAGQGATMGMLFGPIGAIVGGVLGLGSSFLDDI